MSRSPDDQARDPIDPEALARLVSLFLEHTPKTQSELHAGWQDRDLTAVSRAAHALKSSAGNFGARRLVELAGQVERQADDGRDESLEAQVAELDAELVRVRDRLQEL